MDLDNIKKTWQETNIKSSISDEKIQRILDNKGKGAFEKLVKYERLGLGLGFILLLLCIPISLTFRDRPTAIFYLASIVLMFAWQTYKYIFLKRINPAEMGIIEISSVINRYKKYMFREFITGIIWAFAFCGLWCINVVYKDISRHMSENPIIPILIVGAFFIIMLGTLLIIVWALYKSMYVTNIKIIEQSIKEIKEFEKDNKE